MDLRLRFSDTFALVGILLLVSSVPGYVAQDDAARDLADGHEFKTGEVRLGTVVQLEAILEFEGAAPVVVGPTRTMTVRAAEPGEAPVVARFVHEETVHPIDVALSFGHIHQEARVERTYFDAAGRPVWFDEEHWDERKDGSVAHERVQMRFAEGSGSELAREAGQKLVYHPSGGQLAFMEVMEETRFEIENVMGKDPPGAISSDAVVDHQGILLFRTGNSALEQLVTGEGERCPDCHGGHRYHLPLALAESASPAGFNHYPHFDWYTPEWPASVGMQMDYHDAETQEIFLQVHVVPRVLTPGDGDVVTIQWFDQSPKDSSWVLPRGETKVPLSRLGDILADDRPLYGGIGYEALRAAVRSEEAASGLRQWAADAEPIEFYWLAEPPILSIAEERREGLLPLPGAAQEPVTKYPSRWFLTLARADGDVRAVEVRFVEERGEIEVTSVRDVCGTDSFETYRVHMSCHDVAPDRVAADRPLIDPWYLIQKAEDDAARRGQGTDVTPGPLRAFAYEALLHMETEVGRHYSWARTNAHMSVSGSFNPRWVDAGEHDDLLEGVAFYRHESWNGADAVTASFDLRDGALLSKTMHNEGSGPAAMAKAQASQGPAEGRLVPLDVIAGSALAGGFLLVGLSAVVRFLSWLKAGGALPVFAALYAKIAKDAVLHNERRDQIMDLVRTDPGVTASDVTRHLGYGWGATVHHLETLVRNGFLTAVTTGAKRHYFTMEQGSRQSRAFAAARRDETAALFLDGVAAKPGLTLKDLSELLDRKTSGLSRTGSRLAKQGLVRKERDGMSVRFWPIETASAAPTAAAEANVAAEG